VRKDQTKRAILAAIDSKEAEIARLTIEVGALKAVLDAEAGSNAERTRSTRSNVKSVVLELLERVGRNGLNAQIACDLAQKEGHDLHVKSVSSLLSRLKHDEVVVYVGGVYILKDCVAREPSALATAPNSVVRPLRTSGHLP
jgi:hypothetical protein